MQFPSDLLQRCWFLAGPTACGKSALALELAERLGAEILSMDSMAIYRSMTIGTAKPSMEDQARVPHHLIDLVDPHEEFSVADYVQHACSVAEDVLRRNRVPLFVGGTGLYLRSVLRGVFDGPPADTALRRELERQSQQHGPEALHAALREVDPESADRLHPNDVRRVIRALEVNRLTGQPLSALHSQDPLPEADRPRHVYWLSPPRAWLRERIDRRVDQMLAAGLRAEVRGLHDRPQGLSHTARQALGYKELFDHFEGLVSMDEAVQQIKTRTRQFAKRQHTWFRNLSECNEFRMEGSENPRELADRLASST